MRAPTGYDRGRLSVHGYCGGHPQGDFALGAFVIDMGRIARKHILRQRAGRAHGDGGVLAGRHWPNNIGEDTENANATHDQCKATTDAKVKSQHLARFTNHSKLPTDFRLRLEDKAADKTKRDMEQANQNVCDFHTDIAAFNKLKTIYTAHTLDTVTGRRRAAKGKASLAKGEHTM